MRARIIVGGVVSSMAVLVIGWQLGAQPAVTAQEQPSATTGAGSAGSGPTSAGTTGTGTTGTGTTGTGTSGSGSSATTGTFTGDTTQTRYGPVQVQITVTNGTITDVTALQLTNRDGRSVQISEQAAPILRREALQAQSAQVQAVSGATFTSAGYTTSLQSALDKAGL